MLRTLILAAIASACMGGSALANGQEENRSWQFRTTGDRLNNAYVLDIIERKKNGYYDNLDTTNNYITNFAGDQINCTVQASATGNVGTNTQTAEAGNAYVQPAVTNSAQVIGNTADNNVTTTSSLVNSADQVGSASTVENLTNSGGSNNSGSDFSIGSDDNNTYSPNANYSAQDLLTNGQSNNDSTLDADANNNSNVVNVGDTTTSGQVTQTLNNNQTNSGNQSAQVTNSQGCTFSE